MCDGCNQDKPTVSAVINGRFGSYCPACLQALQRTAHPGSAQYARDRDRDAHEVDLLQPWDSKGNPSKDFIREYPDEARDTFTQEELEKFG